MKKIICFLLLALAMASCEKKVVNTFNIDPLATFSLKPEIGAWSLNAKAFRSQSEINFLSPIEIVKRTTCIRFTYNGVEYTRGFDNLQRDTISGIPCLKMWATDIINTDGEYVPDFIESRNCVLEIWESSSAWSTRDTIGYIPNSVLSSAQDSIHQAYINQDLQIVYRLFENTFTFRPIDGEQYRALKDVGLN